MPHRRAAGEDNGVALRREDLAQVAQQLVARDTALVDAVDEQQRAPRHHRLPQHAREGRARAVDALQVRVDPVPRAAEGGGGRVAPQAAPRPARASTTWTTYAMAASSCSQRERHRRAGVHSKRPVQRKLGRLALIPRHRVVLDEESHVCIASKLPQRGDHFDDCGDDISGLGTGIQAFMADTAREVLEISPWLKNDWKYFALNSTVLGARVRTFYWIPLL